jgi:hypothetical protein
MKVTVIMIGFLISALTITITITTHAVYALTNQMTSPQENIFEHTSGNITSQVAPQGTSLEVTDNNTSENQTTATSGNISTPIAPGGTSVGVANDTSVSEDIPESSAGNVTEPIAPG